MNNQADNYLKMYQWEVDYPLPDGASFGLHQKRDNLSKVELSTGQMNKMNKLDGDVITYLTELDDVTDIVCNDDKNQPLENWWWHLDKIRNKTYPINLLPAHLQKSINPYKNCGRAFIVCELNP